jgi:membrane-associated phospholipid phosphatase
MADRPSTTYLTVLLLLAVLLLPAAVDAQEVWQEEWETYRLSEGIATGVLISGSATLHYGVSSPSEPNWSGGVLFDDAVEGAIGAEDPAVVDRWATTSDILSYGLLGYPIFVDALGVSAAARRNPRTALQIQAVGLQSYAASSLLTVGIKKLVARRRPYAVGCPSGEGSGGGAECQKESRFMSFPSGHTSTAFTGAGFICAIHESLDLYGGGIADRLPCWGAIGAATTSGLARIVSNNHYATDVLAGAAIGVFSGYLLPKILHFGFGGGSEDGAGIEPAGTTNSAALGPAMGRGGGGFGLSIPLR